MKKWSEIKQATLYKLFLGEEEAQQQGYLEKFQYLANECLNLIANGVKPRITSYEIDVEKEDSVVIMPDDFLSFYDVVNYVNGEKNPKITYLTDRTIKLKDKGNYTIFYNALWKDIDKNDIDKDNELDIDYSVLNCLPSYIASQVLAQDDIQRATILKNEFELLLSRLDTNVLYEQNHYVSEGGWY